MSSIKDKNLIFYSVHPNDEHSRDFMKELDKNPNLKRQFVLVCVSDPKIRIPEKIRQLNKIPVLIVAGFNRPIFGVEAVSWLKNNSFQEKANGFEYGSFDADASKYTFLGEESRPSDYNQFFNHDYNHGFVEREGVLNQQFTPIKNDTHITTYDDSTEMKKDIHDQLDQRLTQLRQQRDADVPKAIRRIGGLEDLPMGGNGSSGSGRGSGQSGGFGGQGSGPVYNPNPFGNHTLPQAPVSQPTQPPGHQLPFAMPTIPPMSNGGRGGRGGPTLPFNMPPNALGGHGGGGRGGPALPFQMGGRNSAFL